MYRGGTYRVIETAGNECTINVDNMKFNVPPSGTLDFNANDYWSYDDTGSHILKVYRTPSNPVSVTQSFGGEKKFNPSVNINNSHYIK